MVVEGVGGGDGGGGGGGVTWCFIHTSAVLMFKKNYSQRRDVELCTQSLLNYLHISLSLMNAHLPP